MAVSQRKKSQSKRDSRRAHTKLSKPTWINCPQCGEIKLPHHVCHHCGYYKGIEVVAPKEEE